MTAYTDIERRMATLEKNQSDMLSELHTLNKMVSFGKGAMLILAALGAGIMWGLNMLKEMYLQGRHL